jgi:uncharacterized OB-fold protein
MSEIALTGLPVEFNAALTEGRLTIQHCNNCGKPNMYPRYRCPFCQSNDLKYVEAEGSGTLLTYTVVRAVPPAGFEDDLPYALGAVRLAEGVQLLARLEPEDDGDWGGYACDAEVTFAPHPGDATEARPVAWFRLADGNGS